jgi:mono/diheme cytochrome c family protein
MIGAVIAGIVVFAVGIFLLWVLVYASGLVRPKVRTEPEVTGAAAMERKVLVATGMVVTIGLLLTIYGVFDPIRQANARERQLTTSIDRGVETYATLCFGCHGTDGKSAVVPGTDPPRVTPQLNRPQFADSYMADPDEMKSVRDLVEKTITRGRPGTPMPAWGQSDGGTLNVEQINELVEFITHGSRPGTYMVHGAEEVEIEGDTPWDTARALNENHYEAGVAPTPIPPETAALANVPPELKAGAELFSKNGCVACHSTQPGQTLVGPSLAGLADRAGQREPGKSAEEYITESVRNPSAFIVPGFPGPPSPMPPFSQAQISDDDLKNLIQYLLSLKG